MRFFYFLSFGMLVGAVLSLPISGRTTSSSFPAFRTPDLVPTDASIGEHGPANEVTLTGELQTWHRIGLDFNGPNTSETATPNPFSDYRLTVVFTHVADGVSYTVPGFYAADGNAAETSATTGNRWRAYFAPDRAGEWNYAVRFTTGPDVAINGGGISAGFMDGVTGSFIVAPTDKSGRDHRGKGRLEYVGKHYLRYAETGEWFVKAGADAPENTLAYEDFDEVPNKDNLRKSWQPHAQDFNSAEAGSYTWQGGKGSELLGVVRYLSDKGVNVMSFLTFSLEGDDENVFPHRLTGTVTDFESTDLNWAESVYPDRFDVSRLGQWERIFAYADRKGIYLHFKLQEQENDQLMDGGAVGRERKLYYRELIARFAHHLALNWNMGEENTQTSLQRVAMADFFAQHDPYDHHRVLHTYPGQQDIVYGPLLGTGSAYTGTSIQTGGVGYAEVFSKSLEWVRNSAAAGQKWVVAVDEPNNFGTGIDVDPADRKRVRHEVVWAAFMAGGAGTEFYYGSPCNDTRCENHRTRDQKYTDAGYALRFFQTHFQPYLPDVENANELTPDTSDYVLSSSGPAYAVYRPTGGTSTIDLPAGAWVVRWYNPRDGTIGAPIVFGSSTIEAPDNENDWTALIVPADCVEGAVCTDANPCTINDTLDADCNCVGTPVADSDNDGVCDTDDLCPGADDNQDTDGDGIPDACDNCDASLAGTPCDDGNPETTNDRLTADCECIGDAAPEATDLWLEAECAIVGPQWGEFAGADASAGAYLNNLTASSSNGSPPLDPDLHIGFSFEIGTAGTYRIYARTTASSGDDDSFWVRVNNGAWIRWNKVNYPYAEAGWVWDQVGEWQGGASAVPLTFDLTVGTNTVTFAHRETGTQLDKIFITLAGDAPTGIGEIAQNCQNCAGEPGDACDDGDACTINDTLNADCECIGQLADSDGDGVCDAEDQCPGFDDNRDSDGDGTPDGCDDCNGTQAGTPCDDGNACTVNDALNADCECIGQLADSDGDGVCDAEDQCPGFDDTLDSDGDGTPDGCDDCAGTQAGTPCDDGNVCTVNDTWNADCECIGQLADSDADGVCDAEDQCPGSNDTLDSDGDGTPDGCDDCDGGLAGTPCDDGDPRTENDRLTADCECVGDPVTITNEYWLEAECAVVGSQWELLTAGDASAGTYLNNLAANSSNGSPPLDADFHIGFSFEIATAGTYRIYARTTASSGDDDSFWVRVNNGDWIRWNKINYPYTAAGWVWDQVGEWLGGNSAVPLTFDLPTGANTVTFAHRETGTQLDKIFITLAGDAPTGIGGAAPNCQDCAGEPGDACDDGNACTINDALNADCECIGQLADSDGDGVCDAEDQCPGFDDTLDSDGDGTPDGCDDCDATQAGMPCDDGNACTVNDALNADCECIGQLADSDGDGVCDAEDQCPGFDDTLDSDGDGTPDGCDDCEGAQAGTPCDDGNACTVNDTLNADCECIGQLADSDGDGVCDAEDQCPGFDDTLDSDGDGTPDGCDDCDGGLAGTPCDDGNPQTENDRFTADCECSGDPIAPVGDEYWLEAECAVYGSEWALLTGPTASEGAYLRNEVDYSSHSSPPTDPAFHVRFTTTIETAGTYRIYARVTVTPGDDSFWVQVNDGEWIRWNQINFPYEETGWVWRQVGEWNGGDTATPLTFDLPAGTNTITFAHRESNTLLDKLFITLEGSTPIGTGGAAENCPDEALNASGTFPSEQANPGPVESAAEPLGRLYPNPALDRIILTDLPAPVRDLRLFDARGKLQRRFEDAQALIRTLELSGLPKGVYYLRGQVGSEVAIWRVVLQ